MDESGDIGLLDSRVNFYVVGHIYINEPKRLQRHINKYLVKIQDNEQYPLNLPELKFYIPKNKLKKKFGHSNDKINSFVGNMHNIRKEVLRMVNDYSDGIFVTILDKKSRRETSWTQETLGNYVIGHTLITDVINYLEINEPPVIIYDTGRLSIEKKQKYHNYLIRKCRHYKIDEKFGGFPVFNDTDSTSEPCIWAADMVAGAYYHQCVNNDDCYSKILNKKIGMGLRKYWDN